MHGARWRIVAAAAGLRSDGYGYDTRASGIVSAASYLYRPAQLRRRGACLGLPAAQHSTFRARRGSAGDGPLPLREFTCTVARARLRCCAGDVGGVAGCACGSARLFWARFGGAGVGAGRRTAASCWRACTGSLPWLPNLPAVAELVL